MEAKYLDISLIDPDRVVIYEKWVDYIEPPRCNTRGGAKENETSENDQCDEVNEYSQDEDEPLSGVIPQDEPEKMQMELRRIGLLSIEDGKYHKYCGYNQFTVESYPIPSKEDGWKDHIDSIKEEYYNDCEDDEKESNDEELEKYIKKGLKRHGKWVRERICDPTAKMFVPGESVIEKHKGFAMYETLDNGGIGFLVFIGKDENDIMDSVYVYGRTRDVIPREMYMSDDYEYTIFETLIKKYNPSEIFIGKSPFNKMTGFSGGHGDKWDGNSILMRIGTENEFKYVHIGTNVFEFTTDEVINKYVSSVGNNCVPYPYAESKNLCYDMSNREKTPVTDHPDRDIKGEVFNGHDIKATYEPMDNVVKITGRDTDVAKIPLDCKEETRCVKFCGPVQVKLMGNTCV